MGRMIANSAVDTVVGVVPFVGDLFDIGFRANMKNLALLKAHLAHSGYASGGRVIEGKAERI